MRERDGNKPSDTFPGLAGESLIYSGDREKREGGKVPVTNVERSETADQGRGGGHITTYCFAPYKNEKST